MGPAPINCTATNTSGCLGFYYECNPIKIDCMACDISLKQCLLCNKNYAMENSTCIQKCASNFPNCQSCDENFSNCQSCNSKFILENNQCHQKCGFNFPNCQFCDQTYSNCRSCKQNYVLVENNKCVQKCSYNFPNCSSCDETFQKCISCKQNYALAENQCHQRCSFDFPNCQSCDQNFKKCLTCRQNYVIQNNRCFLKVPCQNQNCKTCLQNGYCTECQSWSVFNQTNHSCYIEQKKNETIIQPIQNKTENKQFTRTTIQQAFQNYNKAVKILANSTSLVNSSPLYRILLGSLSPVFGLFDDYWFYIYHQNSFENLQILPNILVFMYFINSERIMPDYFKISTNLTISAFGQSEYYMNYTSKRILEVDENMTHLEQNLQPLLIYQYLYQFAFFSLVVCIVGILKLFDRKQSQNQIKQAKNNKKGQTIKEITNKEITKKIITNKEITYKTISFKNIPKKSKKEINDEQKQHQKSISMYSKKQIEQENEKQSKKKLYLKFFIQYFDDCIKFKNIILTLIGANLIFLSFQISLQFGIFFSFSFIDTLNLVFTVCCGMIFIVAFCVLLALSEELVPIVKISKKDTKKDIKQKLLQKQEIQNQDFYELIFECIKCIIYGFIHGYFINYNQAQYVMLIIVKLFFIWVIIKRQCYFKSKLFSILKLCYFLMGIGVDILCLFSKMQLIPESLTKTQIGSFNVFSIIQFVVLVFLKMTVLLDVIINLYLGMKMAFCMNKQVKKRYNLNLFNLLNKVNPVNNSKSTKFIKQKPLIAAYKSKTKLKTLINKNFNGKTVDFQKNQDEQNQQSVSIEKSFNTTKSIFQSKKKINLRQLSQKKIELHTFYKTQRFHDYESNKGSRNQFIIQLKDRFQESLSRLPVTQKDVYGFSKNEKKLQKFKSKKQIQGKIYMKPVFRKKVFSRQTQQSRHHQDELDLQSIENY